MNRIMADFFIPDNVVGKEMEEYYYIMSTKLFKREIYWSSNHNCVGARVIFESEEDMTLFALRFGKYLE